MNNLCLTNQQLNEKEFLKKPVQLTFLIVNEVVNDIHKGNKTKEDISTVQFMSNKLC